MPDENPATQGAGASQRTPAHTLLMGLYVEDEAAYAEYRRQMTPLLHEAGGTFAHDFAVSKVHHSEATGAINRVFCIRFPSESAYRTFFARADYKRIRERLYEPAVPRTAQLAAFNG